MARPKRRTPRTRLRDRPWFLALISAVFVAAGVFLLIANPAEWLLPVMCLVFFGSCLLVFTAQMVQQRREKRTGVPHGLPAWVAIVGAVGLAVACGLLLDSILDSPGPPNIFLGVVCLVGVVFFGGGGLLLLAREISTRMRK